MKLVLLPGMDGTAELFDDFLSGLGTTEYQVIRLPQSGNQDYDSLASYIRKTLPDQEFLLLAESFSGPLAAILAARDTVHLKGIIFIASFLSPPNKLALALARVTPLKLLSRAPFSGHALRHLMLGSNASSALLSKFRQTVASVPSQILNARIYTMQHMLMPSFTSKIPVFYLSGSEDRLVHPSKISEFEHCFPCLIHRQIKGPHFLLQANPKACSSIVREILSLDYGANAADHRLAIADS